MAFSNGHALVIGVGNYAEHRLQDPLPTANGEAITVLDARGVAAALADPNVCAYPASQVTFLPPEQTTRQGMINALKKLASDTGKDDTVVIFFCGHGSLGDDNEYYFGTQDVKLAGNVFKQGTGLGKTEFLDLLRQIHAQKLLLIINACFSGNVGAVLAPGDEGATLGAPPPADLRMQVLGTGEGRAIITASRSTQFSRFAKAASNTFFGKALIDALQGKGMPGGPYIGLYELYDAVYRKVKQETDPYDPIQEPVLTIVDQVGPFPVALSGQGSLGVLGADDIRQTPPADAPVEKISKEAVQKMSQKNTGHGGINISGGNVSAGGDFVGGDKIVNGDEVRGDKITGGDKITVGNMTGNTGVAIGRNAQAHVTQGASMQEITNLINAMNAQIDARPDDPNLDKQELKDTVDKIAQEANKGDAANQGKLERWVKYLGDIAPDVLEVAATTLLNPVAGVTVALKNIIQKARQAKTG